MATIKRALFSVIWTNTYTSVLDGWVDGKLVTRGGYSSAFENQGPELGLPWEKIEDPTHFSNFWGSYLGGAERLAKLTADSAWDHLLPLKVIATYTVTGPASALAGAKVFVYPSGITVVIEVGATGKWAVNRFASSLAALRTDKHWMLQTPSAKSENRSLDGIASALRDEAVKFLTGAREAGPPKQAVLTVAAPISADGDPGPFGLTNKTARSCLAGLAVLGPPGDLDDANLLEKNKDSRRQGRIYALTDGHAIWHSDDVVNPQRSDGLECLLRNHTDLVAQISALAGVVSWAADQTEIPKLNLGVVQRAVLRLNQLHEGDKEKTYRSLVAKVRIDPLVPRLALVAQKI